MPHGNSLFTIYDDLGGISSTRASNIEEAIARVTAIAEKQRDEFGALFHLRIRYIHDHDAAAWYRYPDSVNTIPQPDPSQL